jgi:hypothetical protein
MKKVIILLQTAFLFSCAHRPKCGNPEGAKVVLIGTSSCQVRIRQVTVGSELKIPSSLKGNGLAQFQMEWIEAGLSNGQIELGHFILIPISEQGTSK